jgi:hypothetical protein
MILNLCRVGGGGQIILSNAAYQKWRGKAVKAEYRQAFDITAKELNHMVRQPKNFAANLWESEQDPCTTLFPLIGKICRTKIQVPIFDQSKRAAEVETKAALKFDICLEKRSADQSLHLRKQECGGLPSGQNQADFRASYME